MQESKVLVLVLWIFFPAIVVPDGGSSRPLVSLPGCPDKCGNVSIPYPFGIGTHCAATHFSSYFNLICNNNIHPTRPTVGDSGGYTEITSISLEYGEMRVLSPISHICFTSSTSFTKLIGGYELQSTPFLPSPSRNRFTAIGCNTLGLIGGHQGAASQYVAGCYSYCEGINSTSDGAPCAGMGCCEAAIPANLTSIRVMFEMNQSKVWGFNPCFYGMVAEVGWYSFRQQDLIGRLAFIDAPVIADWAIRNGSCPEEGKKPPSDYACLSENSYCMAANNGPGYLCQCSDGYEGNPYIQNGCQDIDECMLRNPCKDRAVCQNIPGNYSCICKKGKHDAICVSVIVVMALACIFTIQLLRKRHKKEKDEYFRQNGGLKLYYEMRSRKAHTIRILTEKEIKRATDNYNEDQVLGCGGHGMVYRGTLDDHTEVAIKKSKVINDDCREEFVNEIIILSQINHRNIVSADHRPPIPLGIRLKIATQSAEALAYLHSSTSLTILHGDVKSANILLDDEHNAKVADFGASALKSMDESEFIMFVQGTLGYLDPESFISHHLTDKSDVYSFGVVLLELMTRKRAMYADQFSVKKSLSYNFLLMFRQNKHQNMLDFDIIDETVMAVLEKLAKLAVHCLSPNGEDRPTMKEVAERLQILRRLHIHATSGRKNNYSTQNHLGSSSLAVPLDDMTYRSMETSTLVWA
ncbi:wall-associated receptor kinase 4 [Setaria viridis]|uniref:wall-associated receptor kinase 4 n=1 Tax=Setaria viridis TaxID=4556 RepID=UPI003B3A80DB